MANSISLSGATVTPWYKQFWPWFIIFVLSCSVVSSLSVVYLAYSHEDGVVRDDWYKDGQAINRTLDRDNFAKTLALAASFRADEITGEVVVTVTGKINTWPEQLELWLSHPTQVEKDDHLELHHTADGIYVGQLKGKMEGKRYIELSTSQWRLSGKARFPNDGFELHAVN